MNFQNSLQRLIGVSSMLMAFVIASSTILILLTATLHADDFPIPPGNRGDNIALDAAYEWNIAPNYEHCTDLDDAVQLTDGLFTSGYFWTQMSTVGWTKKTPVVITLDLGAVYPIEGMLLNTAGGVADVKWPQVIGVAVSEDDQAYHSVGDLIMLGAEHGLPPDEGYAVHAYKTNGMATHGRYVKIVVEYMPYFFVDEIEVYRGADELLSQPYPGPSIGDVTDYFSKKALVVRQIKTDANALAEQIDQDGQIPADEKTALKSEIHTIIAACDNLYPYTIDTFHPLLPLNDLHARLFQLQADFWRAQGYENITVWGGPSPWDPTSPTQTPGNHPADVSISMMPNEYRSSAFNISNATEAKLDVRLSFTGLPGGRLPPYIKVQQAQWTASAFGPAINSALPDANCTSENAIIEIPPGMTRQVWLTFNPTALTAGRYEGQLMVDGGSAGTAHVPIQLRLSHIRFPSRPTLSVGGWDYTNTTYGEVTAENREAFISMLKSHFVDTTWATYAVMPWSEPEPTSFSAFDEWVDRWPDARQYRIYLDVPSTFDGHDMGTEAFNTAVARWVSAHVAHWRQRGIDPGRVGLLLVDEPHTAEQAQRIIAWAQAISAAAPELQIWEDPIFEDPASSAAMSRQCNVLCLDRPGFLLADEVYRSKYRQQISQGLKLEFYSAKGPVDMMDPYSHYRLQAWSSWQEGATAMSFWSFADQGNVPSWKKDLPKPNTMTPLFIEPDAITEGKAMLAIREGVEDFEYLVMLKNRIAELESENQAPPSLGDAKKMLANAASDVLEKVAADDMIHWDAPKDRNSADQKRKEVLEALEKLDPQGHDTQRPEKPTELQVVTE